MSRSEFAGGARLPVMLHFSINTVENLLTAMARRRMLTAFGN
jgi:hypothetical protein